MSNAAEDLLKMDSPIRDPSPEADAWAPSAEEEKASEKANANANARRETTRDDGARRDESRRDARTGGRGDGRHGGGRGGGGRGRGGDDGARRDDSRGPPPARDGRYGRGPPPRDGRGDRWGPPPGDRGAPPPPARDGWGDDRRGPPRDSWGPPPPRGPPPSGYYDDRDRREDSWGRGGVPRRHDDYGPPRSGYYDDRDRYDSRGPPRSGYYDDRDRRDDGYYRRSPSRGPPPGRYDDRDRDRRDDRYDSRGPPPPRDDEPGYVMNTRGNNGLVVGPQGSNVKRIEDETGARVKCLKDKTTVEIYGSPEAVRRATDKIIDLLEAKSGGSRDRPGEKRRRDDDRFGDDNKRPRGAQNDSLLDYLRSSAVELGVSKEFPPDFVDESNADEQGNVEETASITNYVGLIIGKQGRMHSEIQRIVDIPMTINKEDETVTFKGPAANVGRGLALIREVIELTNAVRDARNATRERDDVEETISITGNVGAVVGKQGNTVKRIKSQLPRCLFQVDRNSETVLVRGAPEMVELAKRLVSEAIENVQARARERGGDVDADMGGEAPMEQDRDLRERLG